MCVAWRVPKAIKLNFFLLQQFFFQEQKSNRMDIIQMQIHLSHNGL
jgi:hypothetical protein